MFKLARTFDDPLAGDNVQRGFPAPGDGAQTVGDYAPPPTDVPRESRRWVKGIRSWLNPSSPSGEQRGFPAPGDARQYRPAGTMDAIAPIYGLNIPVTTPYYDRGAAAVVQNYGKVLTNPIGAGIVALSRPQASYGQAAEYINGAIWWTSQAIPTSVNLQGLSDPAALLAVLGTINVQAVLPGAQ